VSRPGDGARARGGADPIPVASARRRLMALARLLSRSDRWLLLAIGALAVLITFCSATQSLAIKWMIDGATDGRWALATGAALVGGLAAGMLGASGRVYMNLQIWAARIVGLEVSRTTVTHAASMPGLDQVSIVTASGVDFVRSAFAVPDLVMLAARIAVGVVLLATVDPLLILVVVFAAPSVLLATRAQRHVDRATAEAAELRRGADHLHGLFAEPTAAMEMRVFGAVDKLNARADHLWRRGSSVKFWGAMRAAGVSATGWLLGVAYVGALAVTAFRASAGEATPGTSSWCPSSPSSSAGMSSRPPPRSVMRSPPSASPIACSGSTTKPTSRRWSWPDAGSTPRAVWPTASGSTTSASRIRGRRGPCSRD
jgi:ABC-type multidrug transport system fused ATPase/permease subunit